MGFETLEHTADVGLRIWASSLDELFAEAGIALVALMGTARGNVTITEQIAIDAPDVEALLVDWLSELLYLFDSGRMVPARFDVHVRGAALTATVGGMSYSRFRQHGPAVKAVTYHRLRVGATEDGYEAVVYLDV